MRRLIIVFLLVSALHIPLETVADKPDEQNAFPLLQRIVINKHNIGDVTQLQVLNRGVTTSLEWHPSGNMLALGGVPGVWLYDAEEISKDPTLLSTGSDIVTSVAFSKDGSMIAAGTGSTFFEERQTESIIVWDVESTARLFEFELHEHPIDYLFFSDDLEIISADDSGKVQTTNLESGKSHYLLEVSTPVQSISANGMLAFSRGTEVVLWNLNTEETNATIPFQATTAIEYSADANMLALAKSDTVQIWDPNQHKLLREISDLENVNSVSFSRDASVLLISTTNSLVTVDLATLSITNSANYENVIFDTKPSPMKDLVAVLYADNTVSFLDISNFEEQKKIQGYIRNRAFLRDMLISRDNNSIVAVWGSREAFSGLIIRRWDIDDKLSESVLSYDETSIESVAIHPNANQIAVAIPAQQEIQIVNLSTGNIDMTLETTLEVISSLAFSQDGQFLAAGSPIENTLLIDISNKEKQVEIPIQAKDHLYFGLDDHILILGSTRLWNFQSSSEIDVEVALPQEIATMTVSLDKSLLAVATSNGRIHVIDLEKHEQTATLETDSHVSSLAFSPDNTLLVCGTESGTIEAWDLEEKSKIVSIKAHTFRFGEISEIGFSSDGTFLITGSQDTTVRLWGISS